MSSRNADTKNGCVADYYEYGHVCMIMYRSNRSFNIPPPPGIPRAFDTFAVPGRRQFDYQSLPGRGEFDLHALEVGNLNCNLNFIKILFHNRRPLEDVSAVLLSFMCLWNVPGVGALITWMDPSVGHLNGILARVAGNLNNNFQKVKCPGWGCWSFDLTDT